MFGGIAFLRHGSCSSASQIQHSWPASASQITPILWSQACAPDGLHWQTHAGYVFIDAPGIKTEAQLRFWLERCERFVSTLPPKGTK